MYETERDSLKVLVAHPGGPFFRKKDDGWWSIPKGEPEPGENMYQAALREFEEETGMTPTGPFLELGTITQKNRKVVHAWAFEGCWPDGKKPQCNEITLEFPKGSGKNWTFPEIDEVLMLEVKNARIKLRKEQIPFLDRLMHLLKMN